jgi:hypothetical protein
MDITPGIYTDVPDAVYRSWPALSHSAFETFITRSPWHYRREQLRTVKPPKPDYFILGGLVDCLLFTPHAFADLFIVAEEAEDAPINPKTGKLYGRDSQKFSDWLAQQPPGREIVDAEDMRIARAMVASVMQSSAGYLLTDDDAEPQVSMVWRDQGVLCKGRLDCLRRRDQWIIDLKTANCAEPVAFARTVEPYGYHRQAAWYVRGANLLGAVIDAWSWVVVEKDSDEDRQPEPRYAVVQHDMPEEWIVRGAEENETALTKYCRCERDGVWPSYPSGVIEPPKWVKLEELL